MLILDLLAKEYLEVPASTEVKYIQRGYLTSLLVGNRNWQISDRLHSSNIYRNYGKSFPEK